MRLSQFLSCATIALGLAQPSISSAKTTSSLAVASVSRMSTPWWNARFAAKQALIEHGNYDLVWLGDSITQNWEKDGGHGWDDYSPIWDKFYGNRKALNLGFKGDSTCHVIWRLEHGELAFKKQPRAIVLLIGANNFGHVHTDAAETFDGIEKIVDMIHAHLPETRIIVLAVLPSIRSSWVDSNTHKVNEMLASHIAKQRPWVSFVNASSALAQDGVPDRTRFLDIHLTPPDPPLHPDARAQERIAEIIEPQIAHDLSSSAH